MNSHKISVRRSFIFTPGLKPEMFPKAISSGADMVCIELEDGIAIKDKDEARKRASELMPNASHLWQYKNEDGVAEAALLAYFGIQHGSATAKILN